MKKILWTMVLLLVLAGCVPKAEPLRYVIIPSEEAVKSAEQYAPFTEYLSDYLGRDVELLLVSDYAAVVEAMKYGHADFARFGPFNYILATQEAEVEAFAVGIKEDLNAPYYKALIVTRADRNILDLNGKSFAHSDVASTSGYLAPTMYLQQNGIQLGEIFFSGSHSASIEAVKNGTVDAAGIPDNRYLVALKEGIIEEGEFDILWESDPIPNAPITVQKSMGSKLKERLQEAFLAAPRELVEGLGVGEIGYTTAQDSDYDIIREMQRTKESLDSD